MAKTKTTDREVNNGHVKRREIRRKSKKDPSGTATTVRWLAVHQFRDRGTGEVRSRSKSFGKKSDAEDQVSKWLREYDRTGGNSATEMTVGDLVDEWLDFEREDGRLAASTIRGYADVARIYVRPYLAAERIDRVRPATIRGVLERLKEKGLGSTAMRHALAVIRRSFEFSVTRLEVLADNPANGVRIPRPKTNENGSRAERRIAAMNGTEAAAFVDALEGEPRRVLFLVLLFCGLRPSEAFALRYSDFVLDDDRPRVQVRRTVQKDEDGKLIVTDRTKTRTARRDVPLDPTVVEAIRDRKKAKKVRFAESLVFSSRDDDSKPLDRCNVRRSFLRIAKKADLGETEIRKGRRGSRKVFRHRFTLYSLRHTFATLRLAAGVPTFSVSRALGHTKTSFTEEIYADFIPEMEEGLATAVGEMIANGRA